MLEILVVLVCVGIGLTFAVYSDVRENNVMLITLMYIAIENGDVEVIEEEDE